MRHSWVLLAIAASSAGCIKQALVNGQIEGTRQASAAFDTLGDYHVAERGAAAGLIQFEGMHVLAPDNEDALFLLTKGWTGYAYGFIEDELERAEDDLDEARTAEHKRRAVAAYGRAIEYGLELLGKKAPGFDEAKGSEASLAAWLAANFTTPDDAANLFWPGYAWVARTNLMKDDAESVAQLYVGVALVARSVAIDPDYNHASGHTILGAYHARSATAELEESKKHFDEAIARTGRRSMLALFNLATKYACVRADTELYQKLLQEILAAEDQEPGLRLLNAVARRRAERWLGAKRMFDACSMEVSNAS